ncbi:molybdopterin converting factor subunit 1 [Humisphaera borealis]|uniref:Molybdopterin synthase sulfur carrier subunit n=1 Tax=Humisphaera borealis TaxID=2807512 RepID=A0A7M2WXP2_9BACT|nr:molybdopterin converting factor subunit 1 [Humisphaera borealis]QOV89982.1 molybdopterin converting factor subunit 1 [Humisphaera borealis]
MTITVQFFALLRDRAGVGETKVSLPDGMTVEQAVDRLTAQFPAIVGAVSRIAFAVNREYADGQTILHDGDELALIPPVSGG